MKKILELLDSELNTENSIFILDGATASCFGGNAKANEHFANNPDQFDFSTIFYEENPLAPLLKQATEALESQERFEVAEQILFSKEKEKYNCNLEFTFVNDSRQAILMVVKIQEDQRPHYIKLLLDRSKRPAFLIEPGEHFQIRAANEAFYKSFACTEKTIQAKYGGNFVNFLPEEGREEYISDIRQSLHRSNSAIVDVPLQTAFGEDLLFYFSKDEIKDLLEEGEECYYCLLVGPKETLEEVEYPYDRPEV